jgi:hypothetical protein
MRSTNTERPVAPGGDGVLTAGEQPQVLNGACVSAGEANAVGAHETSGATAGISAARSTPAQCEQGELWW